VHMRRSRQRGQAVVEFGLIAILFTLLMFAVVDFGLLLNGWLTVASDAQQLARDAAVGAYLNTGSDSLVAKARSFPIPGVTADNPPFPGGYCCAANSALVLTVTYYNQCTPNVGPCAAVDVTDAGPNGLDVRYGGACPTGSGCRHPARPSPPGTTTCTSLINPCPGDTVVVTLRAAGAQVITPLVRPFFQDPVWCPSTNLSSQRCYVSLSNRVTARFDGSQLP
jgi:Flp pilus assembly protein TadG